uniref:NACHT domain-containing protein n=1 Tax=Scylla olivacea TaxID=85551 RepID=A0A0P4W8K7_SCYOL
MASGPRSPYKINWNKYEDAMRDVVRREVCRVFLWLYQGGPKYVGDYLDEIPQGRRGLNKDQKNALSRREPPTAMDITLLYHLLQRACSLPSADDPAWTDPTGSDPHSLEHTLYLIKEERNKLSHEGHTQEAQQMSDHQLDLKLNYLRWLCANLLVEAARRCGRLHKEIVELNDKMEVRLQEIRGVTSDKFVMMAKEEMLKTAQTKMVDEWYQQPLLQSCGKPVTLDDVLQWRTRDGAAPAFILVTGETGIGKSSLCRHVQECWLRPLGDGRDPLQCYQLVLHVRCRDVNISDAVRLLQEELLPDTAWWCSSDTLSKFLQTISTLWIFDGLEEATEEAARLINSLFGKRQQNNTVLVTARPEYGGDFLRQHSTHMTHLSVNLCGADPLETIRSITQSKECDGDIKRHAKSLMEDFEELDPHVQQELRNPLKLRLTLQGWEGMRTLIFFSQEFDLSRLYQKISDTQIKSLSESLSKGPMTEAEATRKVEKWFLFLCESAFKLVLCRKVFEGVIDKEMLRTLEDKCDELGLSSSRCLSTFLSCPVFSSGNTGYTFCHDTQVHFLAARYVDSVMKESSDLHSHTLKLFNISTLQENHSRYPQLGRFLPVLLILVSLISGSASEAVLKMVMKLLLNAIPLNASRSLWFEIAIMASFERKIMREIGRIIPKEWLIFDEFVEAARRLLEYSQPNKVLLYMIHNPEELKKFEQLFCNLASLPVDMNLTLRSHFLDLSGKANADKYLKIICCEDSPCVLVGFEGHLSDEGYSLLGHPKISDYCEFLKLKVNSTESLETLCQCVRDFEFLQRIEVVIAMKQIPFTSAKLQGTAIRLCLPLMTNETVKDTAKFAARLCRSYDRVIVYNTVKCYKILIFMEYLEKRGIVINNFVGCVQEDLLQVHVNLGSLPLQHSMEEFMVRWHRFMLLPFADLNMRDLLEHTELSIMV